MEKFPVAVPSVLGQFPACALLYRRGGLEEEVPVVHETLSLPAPEPGSAAVARTAYTGPLALDALRAADLPAGVAREDAVGLSPHWLGRVEWTLTDATVGLGMRPRIEERLGKFLDPASDAPLRLARDEGVLLLDAAGGKGAVGFLAARERWELAGLTIRCRTAYASILAVPLDDEPFAESRRLLLQAATDEKPWGFAVRDGEILDVGTLPLQVRCLDADVELDEAWSKAKATVLDANGLPVRKLAFEGRRLRLPEDALYVLLER